MGHIICLSVSLFFQPEFIPLNVNVCYLRPICTPSRQCNSFAGVRLVCGQFLVGTIFVEVGALLW